MRQARPREPRRDSAARAGSSRTLVSRRRRRAIHFIRGAATAHDDYDVVAMTINVAEVDLALIDRALAEDVGAGRRDRRGDRAAGRARRCHDHAEGAGRDLRARRRRGGLPAARPRRRGRAARAGGRVARAAGAVLRLDRLGARAADGRAHGAELPRPALGRRDASPRAVVRAIDAAGGTARLLDTRKTTPGLRALEKRAVADGGGVNHRAGLYDFILIKENHAALAGGVGEAVRRARAARPDLPLAVEVRDAAGDRRGARRRRAATAARQHDAARRSPPRSPRWTAARSSRPPAA